MIPDHADLNRLQTYPALPADEELGADLDTRIHNLTPHVVRLLARELGGGFSLLAVLPPAEMPARVVMTSGERLPLLGWATGLTVRACSIPGEITGLPERATVDVPAGHGVMEVRPNTPRRFYLVSSLVAQALRGQGRDDVFTVGTGPGDLERKDGQVWGTYALEQAPQ
jgi:hypothetical protein